jgi:hypothetical protein
MVRNHPGEMARKELKEACIKSTLQLSEVLARFAFPARL